jgi:transketolase
MAEKKSTRIAYGEALAKLGEVDEKVLVCDADLAHATMTAFFADKYPDRFYNFCIAEANMIGVAAGLSTMGLVPFASSFAMS